MVEIVGRKQLIKFIVPENYQFAVTPEVYLSISKP
jgi:hypothetical protein